MLPRVTGIRLFQMKLIQPPVPRSAAGIVTFAAVRVAAMPASFAAKMGLAE
jgi:hypothetical protein